VCHFLTRLRFLQKVGLNDHAVGSYGWNGNSDASLSGIPYRSDKNTKISSFALRAGNYYKIPPRESGGSCLRVETKCEEKTRFLEGFVTKGDHVGFTKVAGNGSGGRPSQIPPLIVIGAKTNVSSIRLTPAARAGEVSCEPLHPPGGPQTT